MAKGTGAVYVAIETGSAEIDGQNYPFTRGITRVRAGHPLLSKGRNQYFVLADDHVDYEWESATAAPGEKRGA